MSRKLKKEEQREVLKRIAEVLEDSIEYALKETNEYTIGIAQGKWDVLNSVRNMLSVFEINTNKIDQLLDKTEQEIENISEKLRSY